MKTLPMITVLSFVVMLMALSSCSSRTNLSPMPSIKPETKAVIDSPINCATAKRDILVLEEERASVGKQILSGVRSIMPIAAVAGILMGDYQDRVEVATGKYNNDIEEKIAQIRARCGVR